jgi:DNA-binding LytR/AlgR family response regulator
MNVMIVEDSVAVYERLVAMFQEIAGFKLVGYADDAFDALDKLDKLKGSPDHPDAVILDIKLVAGNGIGLLRYIKSHSPGTMVIMLTNHATRQYRELCGNADWFFDKTTEFMRVPEVLQQAFALGGKTIEATNP